MLDSIESLFAGLSDAAILRAELRRLFRWLDDHNLTAIVTAERGNNGTLTRHGLEEYLADCVIVLDHRVNEQISTRRLRVVKYRGSAHGTDEYPYMIDDDGLSVLPITSLALTHKAPATRVSTGIASFGRDAGRERILPWKQRAGVRHGGNREVQHFREVRERRLRPWREVPVFCF